MIQKRKRKPGVCLNCQNPTSRVDVKYCGKKCEIQCRGKSKYPLLNFDDTDFSQHMLDIIIGSLLGDGCLIKYKNKNSSFSEGHGVAQKDYLIWKKIELSEILTDHSKINHYKSWSYGVVNHSDGTITANKNEKNENYKFQTISHPFLTKLEREWYLRDENNKYVYNIVANDKKQRIKILPSSGIELTPRILAIWYYDDGINRPDKKECSFCTDCFDYDEVQYLSMKINETFGLNSYVMPYNENYFRIYIPSNCYLKFLKIIKEAIPNIPDCMTYKTDNNPDFNLDYETLQEITKLIKQKVPQIHIAEKHNISRNIIGILANKDITFIKNKSLQYNNKTGCTGLSFDKRSQKYVSIITINKNVLYLGYYKDKETAIYIRRYAESLIELNLSIEEIKEKIIQEKLKLGKRIKKQ